MKKVTKTHNRLTSLEWIIALIWHFTELNDYENILGYIINVKVHFFMHDGYLKGVDSTVLGVWTTCLCGVTPEKSLSCRGVFSPPLRGVSTLLSAIRFWASCEGERTER